MRGFTLIETLVALVLVTIMSAVMLQSSRSAIELRLQGTRVRVAAFAAGRMLEETLVSRPEELPEGKITQTLNGDVAVQQTVAPGPRGRLVFVEVEARAPKGRAIRMRTLRAAEWRPLP